MADGDEYTESLDECTQLENEALKQRPVEQGQGANEEPKQGTG